MCRARLEIVEEKDTKLCEISRSGSRELRVRAKKRGRSRKEATLVVIIVLDLRQQSQVLGPKT